MVGSMAAVIIECPSMPRRTLYDVNVAAGLAIERHLPKGPGPDAPRRERKRYEKDLETYNAILAGQKARIVEPSRDVVFICGSIEPAPFCNCGHTAEMLCDYPIGDGKTCDLPLCWCCRKHIAEDSDLCPIHFAEFVKKSGGERINPWPPKR